MKQRALSIRQPHAEAIMRGVKKIEYRSGPTKKQERILIYASPQRYSSKEETELMASYGITDVSCDDLRRGVIIGSVELFDCQPVVGGPRPWGWYVRNPEQSKRLRRPKNRPNAVWFIPFGSD
ncbi:MAG: ASCH domain-containing protein [Gemmataceae bacterium]|nr:ASCH domain-containing protein [Gemmataceae bacterium]